MGDKTCYAIARGLSPSVYRSHGSRVWRVLWWRFAAGRFRAMELLTILNRCHRFGGFVYQHAHFSADKKSNAHSSLLLPILPHGFAFLDKCAQALLGILKVKQLIQIDVLGALQRFVKGPPRALEKHPLEQA